MSLMTRICWVCTALALIGFGTLAIVLVYTPVLPPGIQLSPEAASSSIDRSPYDLVRRYNDVLERYDGQTAAPLADLPDPPDEIARAIDTAPEWAADWNSARVRRLYNSLSVQLDNFVADPAHADPESIWERQKKTIKTHLEYSEYRVDAYGGRRPIPIGHGFAALTEMRPRGGGGGDAQGSGMLGFCSSMLFLVVRSVISGVEAVRGRLPGRVRISGVIVFGAVWFFNCAAFPLIPIMWVANQVGDAATGYTETVFVAVCVALLFSLPFAVLSTLFDLLVCPRTIHRHTSSYPPVAELAQSGEVTGPHPVAEAVPAAAAGDVPLAEPLPDTHEETHP